MKTDSGEPGDFPVAVGEHARFEGVLSFRGGARVEGQLAGRVEAHGTLWVGPQASIDGTVEVDELIVHGEVRGQLHVRKRTSLMSSARVQADLETPRVSLQEGGRLEGRCRTATSAADRCGPLS